MLAFRLTNQAAAAMAATVIHRQRARYKLMAAGSAGLMVLACAFVMLIVLA